MEDVMERVTFTAVFQELTAEEGGGYHAYVEELPGAITQGDTLNEARDNLADAIREILLAHRELAAEESGAHVVIREPISVASA